MDDELPNAALGSDQPVLRTNSRHLHPSASQSEEKPRQMRKDESQQQTVPDKTKIFLVAEGAFIETPSKAAEFQETATIPVVDLDCDGPLTVCSNDRTECGAAEKLRHVADEQRIDSNKSCASVNAIGSLLDANVKPTECKEVHSPTASQLLRLKVKNTGACQELLLHGSCTLPHCLGIHQPGPDDVTEFVEKCRDLELHRLVVTRVTTWNWLPREELCQLLEQLCIALLENDYSYSTIVLILDILLDRRLLFSVKLCCKLLERPAFQDFPLKMSSLCDRVWNEYIYLDRISWSRLLRTFVDTGMCAELSRALHIAVARCSTPFRPSDVELKSIVQLFIQDLIMAREVSLKQNIASEAVKLLRRFDPNVVAVLQPELRDRLERTLEPLLKAKDLLYLKEVLCTSQSSTV